MIRSCFSFALALLFTFPVFGAETVPPLTGPVVDRAGLLSGGENQAVTRLIEKLNASGKVQLAILIAESLQGDEIEPYSVRVAEAWKLGKKGVDDGLLLVIAPKEKRMRFEVGYGLEGQLTDIAAKRILSDQMAPYFRQGRFGDGLQIAVEAVAHALAIDLVAQVERNHSSRGENPGAGLVLLLLLFIAMAVILSGGGGRGFGGGGYGGYGGGGFGGGGFGGGGGSFGGGGGGFGGGGSSSSW